MIVGDLHDRDPLLVGVLDCRPNDPLVFFVQPSCYFIEQQDLRGKEEVTDQADPLFFTPPTSQ